MRRFVKRILIFTSSCILIYVVSVISIGLISNNGLGKNFVFPIGNYGHSMLRLNEVKTHSRVDILILGSSHAYRGFDPRIFKKHQFDIFNLGLSSETPIQSYFLLKNTTHSFNQKLLFKKFTLSF